MDTQEFIDKQKQAMQMTMFHILEIIKKETNKDNKTYYQGYYKAYEDILQGIDEVLLNNLNFKK